MSAIGFELTAANPYLVLNLDAWTQKSLITYASNTQFS